MYVCLTVWINVFFLFSSVMAKSCGGNIYLICIQGTLGQFKVHLGLSLVPRLTYEHVKLTNFSKMRVDLAVQVSACTCACTIHVNIASCM